MVTVNDVQSPPLTCPADKSVSTDPGQCSAVVGGIDPNFADSCPGVSVSYVLSGATSGNGGGSASGRTFNSGITTVAYTAINASGNGVSCGFTVTVVDNQPPTLTCPTDKTVSPDPGHASAVVSGIDPI